MPAVLVGMYSAEEVEDMPERPSVIEQAFADAGIPRHVLIRYLGRSPDYLSEGETADLRRALAQRKKGDDFTAAAERRAQDRERMQRDLAELRIRDREAYESAMHECLGATTARPDRMSHEHLAAFHAMAMRPAGPKATTSPETTTSPEKQEKGRLIGELATARVQDRDGYAAALAAAGVKGSPAPSSLPIETLRRVAEVLRTGAVPSDDDGGTDPDPDDVSRMSEEAKAFFGGEGEKPGEEA
jgi:hypothetical protein